MKTLGNIKQWFMDKGDYTHRLNYKLDKNSIVFDLGGYKGYFVEQINNKYGSKIYCYEPINNFAEAIKNKFIVNDNISVFPLAVSNKEKIEIIYINKDSSSVHRKTGTPIEINCITLNKAMQDNNINMIDLIKINIEGDEYPLLEDMIQKNLHLKCKNIQVQFHKFVENYELKYNYIQNELKKTHHLTYRYPFVWENWELNI